MFKINPTNYIAMANVVLKAKSEVAMNSFWAMLHDNYGIGIPVRGKGGSKLSLTAGHRVQLFELVKKEAGLNLKTDHYQNFKSQSQTAFSKQSNQAKALSAKPRAPFIELRYFDGKTIAPGYRGLKVADILTLTFDLVLSLENFDSFVSLSTEQLLSFGVKMGERILVVYRGDNIASPKAVQAFRKEYTGHWAHFGDFDPKGLHIGAVELHAHTLLLPTLDFLKQGKPAFNQPDLYHKQYSSIDKLPIKSEQMRALVAAMEDGELALEQEHLIAREVPLAFVKVT
jgi:hypothetical protein